MSLVRQFLLFVGCVFLSPHLQGQDSLPQENPPVTPKASGGSSWYAWSLFNDTNLQLNYLNLVNLNTNTLVDTISIPTVVPNAPPPPPSDSSYGIAFTPDASKLVVTDSVNLYVYNTTTFFAHTVSIPNANLGNLAITPDGTTAYVVNTLTVGTNGLFAVNLTDFSVVGPIPLEGLGIAVAISPTMGVAYVADTSGFIDVVDTSINAFINIVSGVFVGANLQAIAFTPNGSTAYVTDQANNVVYVIDATMNAVTNVISVSSPTDLVITFDGSYAFVVSNNNSIIPINLASDTALTPITLAGTIPEYAGIAVAPDSKTLYVNNNIPSLTPPPLPINQIIAIDIPSLSIRNDIFINNDAGSFLGIAVTPDPAPSASFFTEFLKNCGKKSSSRTVLFNASASTSPVGNIATYAWNWGDGQSLVTTSPVAEHTYSKKVKAANVSLTVTNTAGTSTFQTYTGTIVGNNGGPSAITSQLLKFKSKSSKLKSRPCRPYGYGIMR